MLVLVIVSVNKVKLFLNIFSIGPNVFFWAQPKDSSFELKSPTNMTLSDKLLMVWAVNGCQSDILFVNVIKFEVDCQGFIIGYDIEIIIPIFFIYN